MNELTIITPCSRPQNLPLLFESLDFSLIKKWVIVHDSTKGEILPQFKHHKISECNEHKTGFSGNTQRNRGIENTNGGFIYFLDDDNIIHPNFWNIIPEFSCRKVNLFQIEGHPNPNQLNLHNPGPNTIDTSMYCVDRKLVGGIRWLPHLYAADGVFAAALHCKEPNSLKIIEEKAAYYNYLSKDPVADTGKCTSTSAIKTANIILANQELYSPGTVKAAHFALTLPQEEISNENFTYVQIRYLVERCPDFDKSGKKKVYIRGSGARGRTDLATCKRFGLEIQGFMAPNGTEKDGRIIDGVPVYSSSKILSRESSHILIASTFFTTIEKEIEAHGWKKDKEFTTLF